MATKILDVTNVQLAIEKTNPPNLVILASGNVTTGGWSNGQLIPYVYVQPPADGIWEFDFVADPPGPNVVVTQVITPIDSEPYRWEAYPIDLKGVRVHSSTNSFTRIL